jgi:hypothetical protein
MHPNGQIPAYEWNFSDVNSLFIPGQFGMFTKRQKKRTIKEIPLLEKSFQNPNQLLLGGLTKR